MTEQHILNLVKKSIPHSHHGMTLPGGGRFTIDWWIENGRVYIEADQFRWDYPIKSRPTEADIISHVRESTR